MQNDNQNPREKYQEKKKRDHYLIAQGGLVQVAKRFLGGKGVAFPDGPTIIGVLIDGVEKLEGLPADRVAAIRNLGFVAMSKKAVSDEKKEEEKMPGRVRQFYHNRTVDPNLNL